MLEGIETGYEEKFDFPYREALPERVYILASVPRSGSTYLGHLLWQSGCLGAPLEYFNFLPTGHYAAAASVPEKQLEIWRSVIHHRTSPNGVFAVKCFPGMVDDLARGNPALFREVTAMLLTANPNPSRRKKGSLQLSAIQSRQSTKRSRCWAGTKQRGTLSIPIRELPRWSCGTRTLSSAHRKPSKVLQIISA